jgi:hypothetical protein
VVKLGNLPLGARLILQCRTDWRFATVSKIDDRNVTLSVGSPKGKTYRVRRVPDTFVSMEGSIPVLGSGVWRAGLVNYDKRW